MWGTVPHRPRQDGDYCQGRWYCPDCGQVLTLFYGMIHLPEHVFWAGDAFEWCQSWRLEIANIRLEAAP